MTNAEKPEGARSRNMMDMYPQTRRAAQMWRLPLITWRLGLGPIVGRVMLVLTTTGRKSGLPRQTMVEYHVLNGRKYSPCAFGEKAQWYRNILADPHVTVQTSDGTERMLARRVTDEDELVAVFEVLMRRNSAMLNWYLQSIGVEPDKDSIRANKDKIYWVCFEPTNEPGPPGLEVDLAWIWPAALTLLLLMHVVGGKRRRRHVQV